MSPVSAPLTASISSRLSAPLRRRSPRLAVPVILSALLVACGGTGGGGISANPQGEVLLTSGLATVVSGSLETVKYRLTDMRWTVLPMAGQDPTLAATRPPVLLNQDCATAEKQDAISATPGSGSLPAGSGGSTWRCNLLVFAPQNASVDRLYDLLLTARDEAGGQVSFQRTLRVLPNPELNTDQIGSTGGQVDPFRELAITPIASVCKPGAPIRLQAIGIEPQQTSPVLYYRWQIVQGPQAVLVGSDTSTAGFIVPDVGASNLIVVELGVSRKPLTADSPAERTVRAVIHADPTFPVTQCTSIQWGS